MYKAHKSKHMINNFQSSNHSIYTYIYVNFACITAVVDNLLSNILKTINSFFSMTGKSFTINFYNNAVMIRYSI